MCAYHAQNSRKGGEHIVDYGKEKTDKRARGVLPRDVCRLANDIICGHNARKARFQTSGLEFDRRAIAAVYAAMSSIGEDVSDAAARKHLQGKVFDSACRQIPYEYMGDCYCGRQKFYRYRRELCRRVAEEMEMI